VGKLAKHETGGFRETRRHGAGKPSKTLRLFYILHTKKDREYMESLDNQKIKHHRHYDEKTHEMVGSSY
jgi:hypothetical protein